MTFRRYDPSDIHWRLIEATTDPRDDAVADDGWVAAQALFCPYYATLEGDLGSDWGVILNPESIKFGRLVFEHHWCGCPTHETEFGWQSDHGGGSQTTDEWALPRSKRPGYRKQLRRYKDIAARKATT